MFSSFDVYFDFFFFEVDEVLSFEGGPFQLDFFVFVAPGHAGRSLLAPEMVGISDDLFIVEEFEEGGEALIFVGDNNLVH